jgi:hypothetical protein
MPFHALLASMLLVSFSADGQDLTGSQQIMDSMPRTVTSTTAMRWRAQAVTDTRTTCRRSPKACCCTMANCTRAPVTRVLVVARSAHDRTIAATLEGKPRNFSMNWSVP